MLIAEINECLEESLNECDENAVCENTEGSYTCTCNAPLEGDGKTCEHPDPTACYKECEQPGEECQFINDTRDMECVCKDGYMESSGVDMNTNCEEVNECGTGSHECDVNADCTNTIGSYNCKCKNGYQGDGASCQGRCKFKNSYFANDLHDIYECALSVIAFNTETSLKKINHTLMYSTAFVVDVDQSKQYGA